MVEAGDSGVKCSRCGRPFRNDERLSAISGEVMGDEYIDSYFLCPDCDVYTREIYHDRFCGPDETDIVGPLARADVDKKVKTAKRCKEPWNKKCRCRAHRSYFGGTLD